MVNLFKKNIIWVAVVLVAAGLIFTMIKANSYFVQKQSGEPSITVYYSSTCSCCKEYIVYLKEHGFSVDAEETENIISVKEKYNIPENIQGCHTSVVGGYVVEGMVPVGAINQLFAEKPQIDGIAVPGMPSNAPGMPGFNGSDLMVYSIKDGDSFEFGK